MEQQTLEFKPIVVPEPMIADVEFDDIITLNENGEPSVLSAGILLTLSSIVLRPSLVSSLKDYGQLVPIILMKTVRHPGVTYEIVDGLHRVAAIWSIAAEADVNPIMAHIYDENDFPAKEVVGIAANMLREANPAMELRRIEELMSRGANEKQVAKITGMPLQTIRKRLKMQSLSVALREGWEGGLISTGAAEAAAKLPTQDQARLEETLLETGTVKHKDISEVRQVNLDNAVATMNIALFETPSAEAMRGDTITLLSLLDMRKRIQAGEQLLRDEMLALVDEVLTYRGERVE